MKATRLLGMVSVLLVMFAACGGDDKKPATKAAPSKEVEASPSPEGVVLEGTVVTTFVAPPGDCEAILAKDYANENDLQSTDDFLAYTLKVQSDDAVDRVSGRTIKFTDSSGTEVGLAASSTEPEVLAVGTKSKVGDGCLLGTTFEVELPSPEDPNITVVGTKGEASPQTAGGLEAINYECSLFIDDKEKLEGCGDLESILQVWASEL